MNDAAAGLRGTRGHAVLPHTADVGIAAWAATLPALFEEAAAGVAELAAEAHGAPTAWADLRVEGQDLEALAYAFLNELVGLIDVRRAAVVGTDDLQLDGHGDASGFRLTARLGLRGFGEPGVRAAGQLKSATYHGLTVEETPGGWRLQAYLDV